MKLNNVLNKKTKIIATLGPSLETKELLIKAFKSGVNAVRLNTSHGSKEEHLKRIEAVKEARKELDLPISIIFDTCGPELRVKVIENNKMDVNQGDNVEIHCKEEIVGKDLKLSVNYPDLYKIVHKGRNILISDGKLILTVDSIDEDKGIIHTTAKNTHYIRTGKSINIPGVSVPLPFLTEKDKDFLIWGIEQGMDFVAASFVRTVEDIKELRRLLDENNGLQVEIISKIESSESISIIDDIIKASDAIMLARGDLGVEVPYYEIPKIEEETIAKCKQFRKPIIIATQMLESMTNSPRPTRAEVTDVYVATIFGSDATMLSGETASGKFPIEAIQAMARINIEAEKNYFNPKFEGYEADYIFIFSDHGRSLRRVANLRIDSLVVGLVNSESLLNKYGIYHGIYTHLLNDYSIFDNDEEIFKLVRELGINNDSKIILIHNENIRQLEYKT